MTDWKHPITRILGNGGISFFTPLTGSAIAQSYFTNTVDFYQTITVGLISSLILTGLSISRELVQYGENKARP